MTQTITPESARLDNTPSSKSEESKNDPNKTKGLIKPKGGRSNKNRRDKNKKKNKNRFFLCRVYI